MKTKRNIKIIIQGFALILTLISCEKEQEYEYPLVYTGDVTNITDTSALFTAKISCLGDYQILESGFIWGVHSNDNNGIKIKNSESFNGIYTLNTNEKLLPGKTFYVRAYIQTQHLTSYGREVSFESPKGQINTGKWSQVYNDDPGIGWRGYIKTSFAINNTTYLALEGDLSTNGDLYSYNSETNTFNFEFSDPIISSASYSATYNGNAYIFCRNAFYLFNPQTKSFTKLSVLDESESKYWVSGFIIDDNLFIGLGNTSKSERYSKDFWKYNITADSWEQIASFPGDYRSQGFSACDYSVDLRYYQYKFSGIKSNFTGGLEYIYHKGKISPAINVGLSYSNFFDLNSTLNTNSQIYENIILIQNSSIGIKTGFGVDYQIKDNQFVVVRFLYSKHLNNYDMNITYQLKLGYKF